VRAEKMTIKIEEVNNARSSFAWMSSIYDQPLRYKDENYNSVQALFQCLCVEKSDFSESQKLNALDRIKNEKTPQEARRIWLSLCQIDLIEVPIETQIEIMRFCIELKLEQYPELKKKLALTNQEDISDQSIINKFWCHLKMRGGLKGENINGKLLMDIRSKLLDQEKYQIFLSDNEVKLLFLNENEIEIKIDYESVIKYCVSSSGVTGKVWKSILKNESFEGINFLKNLLVILKNEKYSGCDGFGEFFYKALIANSEIKEFLDSGDVELSSELEKIFESILCRCIKKWFELCIGKIKFEVKSVEFQHDNKKYSKNKLFLKMGTMKESTNEDVKILLSPLINQFNNSTEDYSDIFA
jgi:predicted NAD-dependent protein-ADP-ribosyltransferase YbiA (DUF1768 family)